MLTPCVFLSLQEFFLYVKSVLRSAPSGVDYFQKWSDREMALNETICQTKADVHEALCGRCRYGGGGRWQRG